MAQKISTLRSARSKPSELEFQHGERFVEKNHTAELRQESWFDRRKYRTRRIYVQSSLVPSVRVSAVKLNDEENLDGTFSLGHIDLHWATSEHAIEQRKADLEMQLNHFDLSYDSYEEAAKVPGATLSIGLLFKIQQNDTDLCKAITNIAPKLAVGGAGETLPSMAHLKFIQDLKFSTLYLYSGSQTQPPCHRSNWIVPKTTFKVIAEQISQLQLVRDALGNAILNNVRHAQNLS